MHCGTCSLGTSCFCKVAWNRINVLYFLQALAGQIKWSRGPNPAPGPWVWHPWSNRTLWFRVKFRWELDATCRHPINLIAMYLCACIWSGVQIKTLISYFSLKIWWNSCVHFALKVLIKRKYSVLLLLFHKEYLYLEFPPKTYISFERGDDLYRYRSHIDSKI